MIYRMLSVPEFKLMY